jgi:hypothetical protein
VFIAHAELINLKLAKHNASNVQILLVEQVSQLEMAHAQQAIAKNVVHLANISIPKLVFVDRVAMDSSNRTKAHSHAKFVDWDKRRDQQKQNHVRNVVTSVHRECNWALMENANHVRVELTEHKEFNQLVRHAHWDAQHQKLARRQSKNAHCQFAHPEHT